MQNIIQKLSNNGREALRRAFKLAQELGHQMVGPTDILVGIAQQEGSVGAEIILASFSGRPAEKNSSGSRLATDRKKLVLDKIILSKKAGPATEILAAEDIKLAPISKKVLEKAAIIAVQNKHHYIGTEHLTAALQAIGDPETEQLLKQVNIDQNKLKAQLKIVLASVSKFSDMTEALNSVLFSPALKTATGRPAKTKATTIALDFFATNLTSREAQKNIDPVIGREEEILRLIQILNRKTKNNPLLLGEAGVGKTAIVEGLAKKITEGEVPEAIANKIIYSLDLGRLIAGSTFRGEFESRLKQIIDEVKQNPDLILFIDEIHNIIGAGSVPGSMDAANILKPALAKGEIRCIGATTLSEYKKYLVNDSALERRFQPILVEQPTVEKTISILTGLKENYEKYHRVIINREAVAAAATLSARFLPEKLLPDKAIDVLDEAAAGAKITVTDGRLKTLRVMERELDELLDLKQRAVGAEKFETALDYRQKEIQLNTKIVQLKTEIEERPVKNLAEISAKEIAKIIAKMSGVPVEDLITEERKRFLNLEKLLAKKIIGQTEAIKAVAEFIRRGRVGITEGRRPIGSFIFLGPSGVGKTKLAAVIAEVIFGSAEALVRIDMSEFAESFNISKLIGSPAGYVGYRDAAILTDAVRKRPYSVILFDEIEKAHFQIFNLLLQILEDGTLTDATGKKIDFKNTIIIMTSNLGTQQFNQQSRLGFGESQGRSFEEVKQEVLKKLNDFFKVEFLNRVDKVIVFNPLGLAELAKIADLQLGELRWRLGEKNINLIYEPAVARLIAKISNQPDQGARAIRKNILEQIESPIARKMLGSRNRKTFKVVVKEGKIVV